MSSITQLNLQFVAQIKNHMMLVSIAEISTCIISNQFNLQLNSPHHRLAFQKRSSITAIEPPINCCNFSWPIGQQSFASSHTYIYISHHDVNRIPNSEMNRCGQCNKNFFSRFGLILHEELLHTEQLYLPIIVCRWCKRNFVCGHKYAEHIATSSCGGLEEKLRPHWKNQSKNNMYRCPLCNLEFNSSFARDYHLTSGHNDFLSPPIYMCVWCRRYFNNLNALNSHIREMNCETFQ